MAANLDKALAAWGEAPEWVRLLAKECDRTSLRRAAARIGVSPAYVSLALNRRRAELGFVQVRAESALLAQNVACPVLGEISGAECVRERAAPFSSANPLRVRLYAACRNGCKYFE
ncbi:MAG: transcriptional regulator [Deltaproteobacteria bacterium]|jgi:hypothetical protein|nr:transcriptional regulator [Deltaproteobacteria bacterium]